MVAEVAERAVLDGEALEAGVEEGAPEGEDVVEALGVLVAHDGGERLGELLARGPRGDVLAAVGELEEVDGGAVADALEDLEHGGVLLALRVELLGAGGVEVVEGAVEGGVGDGVDVEVACDQAVRELVGEVPQRVLALLHREQLQLLELPPADALGHRLLRIAGEVAGLQVAVDQQQQRLVRHPDQHRQRPFGRLRVGVAPALLERVVARAHDGEPRQHQQPAVSPRPT